MISIQLSGWVICGFCDSGNEPLPRRGAGKVVAEHTVGNAFAPGRRSPSPWGQRKCASFCGYPTGRACQACRGVLRRDAANERFQFADGQRRTKQMALIAVAAIFGKKPAL